MDRISFAVLLLIVSLVIHLVEEVRGGFRKALPVGEMPRWLFVGLNVLIYGYCLATLRLSIRRHRLAVPLSWLFAGAMVLNGIGHIAMTAFRRRYFPGVVTAFLLLPASAYLIVLLVRNT